MFFQRKLWITLTAIGGVFLGGCVSSGSNPSVKAVERIYLTEKQRSAVKDAVRIKLRDPNSALFGGYAAARLNNGAIGVCGWVNGKNGFGGYTGMGPFVAAMQGDQVLTVVIDTHDEVLSVARGCRSDGIELGEPGRPTT